MNLVPKKKYFIQSGSNEIYCHRTGFDKKHERREESDMFSFVARKDEEPIVLKKRVFFVRKTVRRELIRLLKQADQTFNENIALEKERSWTIPDLQRKQLLIDENSKSINILIAQLSKHPTIGRSIFNIRLIAIMTIIFHVLFFLFTRSGSM